MGRSDAGGVGNGWIESILQRLAEMLPGTRPIASSSTLNDQDELFPAIFRSEKFLRRSIPVLILTLLTMIAAARFASMLGLADNIETTARSELSMISQIAVSRLETVEKLAETLKDPQAARELLEEALPKEFAVPGRYAFLLDSNKVIIAQKPGDDEMLGWHLNRLTDGNRLLGSFGERAGVLTIELDGLSSALATLHKIGVSEAASLVVVHRHDDLFNHWYQSVRLNIALFLAVSIVLLVILYAYFAQGARSRTAENLYLESNARFDTALARGHCGLWDWDLSRGRIVWSRSMYEMLGMEEGEEVIGFGELRALMHPDDEDLITLANNAFVAKKQQIDQRFRMMHSSGAWVWLRIRAELVRYRGIYPHLIGIAVDITEQEALKQKSRDADIRLRDAIENISEAFVLWDSRKRLVLCNSKYQQLYNLEASAVRSGTSYDDVMRHSRKPRIKTQIMSDRKNDHGAQTFEAQIEDGRWLQISERRTQDGGFVSLGTDITQIKRNEEKLVDSERRHMATIADLRNTQQELERQAQKLVSFADTLNEEKMRANAANAAKSDFLANISHELRTPLNAIIGFSDIMRSGMFGPLGSEQYSEYATDIHVSGSFLLGVINDVLDMSKIEAGRLQLAPEQVAVHELLEETLRIIRIQADEAQINVNQDIPEDLELEADRRALKQILLNLLSNAVKFTPGGGQIDVLAKRRNDFIMIMVRDNGRGIAREALSRLGQPFEQVQDQFTKDHKGSGLGLAIAKSLVKLHGGALKIRSTVGEGTMVAFRMPCICRTPPENRLESASSG